MNPLETYLNRVRVRLPRKGRDDVVQELRVALLDRCDRREAEWGRPLTEAEQAVIVRGFGHPYAVAARYWDGKGLLGGPFAIYYRMTLLWGAAAILVVHVALALWRVSAGLTLQAAAVRTMPGVLFAFMTMIAVVTIVFAALDAGRQRMAPAKNA